METVQRLRRSWKLLAEAEYWEQLASAAPSKHLTDAPPPGCMT